MNGAQAHEEILADPRAKKIATRIRATETWYGAMNECGSPIMKRLAAQITIAAIRAELFPDRTEEGRSKKARADYAALTPAQKEAKKTYARAYAQRKAAERRAANGSA